MEKDQELETIKELILETVQPEKIILFGSRARGNFSDSSDYDILILKKGLTNERSLTRAVNRSLFEHQIDTPIDILAMDLDRWEMNKHKSHLIYSDIAAQGITLYG